MTKKYYDIKVRTFGAKDSSRYITVTKLIPKTWQYIRVHTPEIKGNTATVRIECLYKMEENKNE